MKTNIYKDINKTKSKFAFALNKEVRSSYVNKYKQFLKAQKSSL
jgi:hypothetical protein